MKLSNTVVSIVVITAVLLSVCAVGFVIHQARTGRSEREPQTAAEANGTTSQPEMATSLGEGGAGQAQDDVERRARLKKEREQVLEKMSSFTEEEKEQFRERVRQRFSSQRARRSEPWSLSAEERERMLQDWQTMSEEQRKAALARMWERAQAGRRPQGEIVPGGPREQNTDGEQRVEEVGSEPNGADGS